MIKRYIRFDINEIIRQIRPYKEAIAKFKDERRIS